MKNKFKILESQLELDMDEQGKLYKVFLESISEEYDEIGIKLDSEEFYEKDCWFVFIFIEHNKSVSQQKLCYVDYDGNISEIEDINNYFLGEILKTIK